MPSLLPLPLLLALAVGLAIGGPIIRALGRLKARQVISTDAPQHHQAKAGTPTMGGLIIMAAGAVGSLVIGPRTPELLAALIVALSFSAIGLLDDLLIVTRGKNLGLKARQKLALQFLLAIAFVWWWDGNGPGAAGMPAALGSALHPGSAGVPARFGSEAGTPAALLAALHLLLLVGMSNAVNLTDGLDGLAAGVAVPLFLLFGFIGSLGTAIDHFGIIGNHGLAAFSMAMAGACLGFLWFNAHPASVFMGDTGSLGLGGSMAALAIMLHAELPLLLAAGVYLAEAASVVIQVASFKTTGRRVFRMSPLHHHFELAGWPETRVVMRFWILALALAALTLLWLLHP
jgi:phospho-N-acetylmuramoyl-pentapeptide-transferase